MINHNFILTYDFFELKTKTLSLQVFEHWLLHFKKHSTDLELHSIKHPPKQESKHLIDFPFKLNLSQAIPPYPSLQMQFPSLQNPLPKHIPGQTLSLQENPENPSKHLQMPPSKQSPFPEHPLGQTFLEQSFVK